MRLSLRLSSDLTPQQLLQGAAGAVDAGLGRIWLADNPLERSAPITAAVIAARHPGLDIGLGVVSARERNPVVLTQEMIALQSYTTGRVIVGLGLGSDPHRVRLGLPATSGLELLRRTAQIVHELSRGGAVPPLDNAPGDPFALKVTSTPLPVYIGATGPKTLARAGQIAEGVVLSLGTTAAGAGTALALARAAFTPSERVNHFDGVAYVAFGGIGPNSYERLQVFAAGFLRTIVENPFLAMLLEGTSLDLDSAAQVVGDYAAGRPLPPGVVRSMGICGSIDECLDQLHRFAEAGVDDVALGIGGWNDELATTLTDVATLGRAWTSAGVAA